MSPSEGTLVKIDDAIALPNGIAAAFTRSRSVFLSSDAFVDRIFSAHSLVNEIHSWRWAGVISGEQCGFLLRKVRRDLETEIGSIVGGDYCTAEEIIAREEENERFQRELDEEEQLRRSGT